MGRNMNHGEVTGDETICVVGLGYVGLPTAIAFHSAGFRVIGVDVSETVVEGLNNGVSPLIDSSSRISIPLDSDKWFVTGDFEKAVPDSDVVLITVPTPVNQKFEPDLKFLRNSIKTISKFLKKGDFIVIESTVYPGTTKLLAKQILEKNS